MNILIVSHGLPDEKYLLNGIFAYDQAKAIRKIGYEVTFISIDFRSIRRWRHWGITLGVKDEIRWCSCDFPLGRLPSKYHRYFAKLFLQVAYKKLFKDYKPSLIHSHFSEYESAFLSKQEGIPLVITEHSSSINTSFVSEDIVTNKKLSYAQASQLISVSSALSINIKLNTGFESIIVPNIIDTTIFEKCQKKAHSGFRLVTTSNLILLKRTFRIIEALHSIPYEDIYLDVIGGGSEMSNLRSIVDKYDLTSRVVFHGIISRNRIAKIYEKCDCFIMVSSSETFGVCYAEALSASLPVIATKCGGPEDFVDDRCGVMVEVDNQEQINASVLYMYEHYNDYDPYYLKKKVKDFFSAESVSNQLNSIYLNIINK